jgi:hypothetical protein
MRCCVPDAMSPDGPGPGLRRLLVTCLATAACLHALAVVGGALSAARPGPHKDPLCRGKGACTRVHGGGGVVWWLGLVYLPGGCQGQVCVHTFALGWELGRRGWLGV